MAEFDLIARLAARAGSRSDVALGIGDDAALLELPAGEQLVACCDTLNEGVHFLPGTDPADIGWKALAVNLSDLAAMGARPAWVLLSLSLPQPDAAFIDGFMHGFSALADLAGVALVGGDTTSGPLSVCVTALGLVPKGAALTRAGAQPGDAVFVSGTLGDAAAALEHLRAARIPHAVAGNEDGLPLLLRDRLHRPTPRIALGQVLRARATAAIDVSDGLLADLAHIARASGVGIELDADALPASEALRGLCAPATRLRHQATGGDDYELAFTVPADQMDAVRALFEDFPLTPALSPIASDGGEGAGYASTGSAPSPPLAGGKQGFRAAALRACERPPTCKSAGRARGGAGVRGPLAAVTRIGRVVAGEGVRLLDANGASIEFARAGWEHFAESMK